MFVSRTANHVDVRSLLLARMRLRTQAVRCRASTQCSPRLRQSSCACTSWRSQQHARFFTRRRNSAQLVRRTHIPWTVRCVYDSMDSIDADVQDSRGILECAFQTSSPLNNVVPKYRRVMLKISGEALQGHQGFGLDYEVLNCMAREIAAAVNHGIQIAIVVGGGNYFRGASAWKDIERATGDYVGMLATVMNALCLQAALEALGVPTRVQTAIEMREVAEPYIRRRAIRHLERGRVVIFGAGTGNPFFTTDTAAALRTAEVNAEVFLKATKVDGIYDCDPKVNPHAKKYTVLSYRQVSLDNIKVMDETAITLCKENHIPVIVFDMMASGNILKAVLGEAVGTVVCSSVNAMEPRASASSP